MSTKPMLSPEQCAVRLGLNRDTVRRFIKTGQLPAAKIGRWRVDPDDLDAFIARRKQATAPAASASLCEVPPHARFA